MSIEKAKEFLLALNDKDAHDAWKAKMAGTKNDDEALRGGRRSGAGYGLRRHR